MKNGSFINVKYHGGESLFVIVFVRWVVGHIDALVLDIVKLNLGREGMQDGLENSFMTLRYIVAITARCFVNIKVHFHHLRSRNGCGASRLESFTI